MRAGFSEWVAGKLDDVVREANRAHFASRVLGWVGASIGAFNEGAEQWNADAARDDLWSIDTPIGELQVERAFRAGLRRVFSGSGSIIGGGVLWATCGGGLWGVPCAVGGGMAGGEAGSWLGDRAVDLLDSVLHPEPSEFWVPGIDAVPELTQDQGQTGWVS